MRETRMRAHMAMAACLLLSAAAPLGADGGAVAVTRMHGRTLLEGSRNFFRLKVRGEEGESDAAVDIFVSMGLGVLRWDGWGAWTGRGSLDGWRRGGEARVHADAGLRVNSGYFYMGAFATCGERGGPALGVRAAAGWQTRHDFFLGAHWEFAAALPGTDRGSRAGLGLQAGLRF
jgi:hypothetical protein